VFSLDGTIYRQVNESYHAHYARLIHSGLYMRLVKSGMLIEHAEVDAGLAQTPEAYVIIRPELVRFVSYPYEWCFGQLQAAALTTLAVQRMAMDYGMSLKDGSAYNIQFLRGNPCLIDTLSFETYREGEPWTPYRQFCQHFLVPLALMVYADVRLGQLSRVHLDGIPLDLGSRLLPLASYLNLGILLHLHLHAGGQKRLARAAPSSRQRTMTRHALLGLLDSLEATVRQLHWKPHATAWGDYTPEASYGAGGVEHKAALIAEFLDQTAPQTVWDLGANAGQFSRLASRLGAFTLAFDCDAEAVEINYRQCVQDRETNLLPLVMDLTNPSPAIGWENCEREAWLERGPADVVMALALVHHLAISNNVPLEGLARLFARLGRWLIVEFVPKGDLRTQELLARRDDMFANYTREGFESAFKAQFWIRRAEVMQGSARVLFLMERHDR
jgi:hypothetical protein